MDDRIKIGILYICTGPYNVFWKMFYDSMDKNLMPETEKTYYVFTDSESIYKENESNVVKIHIENKPWPLVTLLRFHMFIGAEEQLRQNDFLLFSNANLACKRVIKSSEILPEKENNFFFTIHPGYFNKKPKYYVYERRSISTAYIPYNHGKHYVIGAFFGGKTEPFLRMCHELSDHINDDLKKNIIARWHDESHINRFILNRNDIRFLTPSYCYPCGFDIDYENVIYAVDKQSVFDVERFKGYRVENVNKKSLSYQKKRILSRMGGISAQMGYMRDKLFNKKA